MPSRLETARLTVGMDGVELDKAAGVGQGRTSRTERRIRVDGIPLDTVVKLARALKVRPAWLALGEEPMFAHAGASHSPPVSTPEPPRVGPSVPPEKAPLRKLSRPPGAARRRAR